MTRSELRSAWANLDNGIRTQYWDADLCTARDEDIQSGGSGSFFPEIYYNDREEQVRCWSLTGYSPRWYGLSGQERAEDAVSHPSRFLKTHGLAQTDIAYSSTHPESHGWTRTAVTLLGRRGFDDTPIPFLG